MTPGPAARGWIGGALVSLGACLVASPTLVFAQDLPEPAQNATAGAAVFGSKGCIECHAVRGLGGREGPDLGRLGAPRSFYDVAAALWNHVPRMAGARADRAVRPRGMSSRETADLFAFLYTIDYFHPPGDVEDGRRLFAEKRCVVCHQAGGVGGVVGPDLSFIGQYRSSIPAAAAMWNHGPAMVEEMRARGIERPTFTGEQLVDLFAYLEAVSGRITNESMHVVPGVASRGERLFEERSCARCHGSRGQGRVGPGLVGRAASGSLLDFAAAMWNKAPAMMREMRARGIGLPNLDGSDMADIVAYLYSVGYFDDAGSASRGASLIAPKRCVACHAGGTEAGDLREGRPYRSPAAAVAVLWSHVRLAEGDSDRGEWTALTPRETADLIAYLMERRGR